jgi:hypothetical protein
MVVGDAGVDANDDDEDEFDDDDSEEDADDADNEEDAEVLDDDGRVRSLAAIGDATDADGGRVVVRKTEADVDLDLD